MLLSLDPLGAAAPGGARPWPSEQNGGSATIRSYEEVLGGTWPGCLPDRHHDWYAHLPLWHGDEHGIYVHAGLRPGVHPAAADPADCLWIRSSFLESDYAWRKPVIFGHTPPAKRRALATGDGDAWPPLNRPEKIGIDTGAAHGGPLCAVMLPERRFFTASP